MSFYIFLLTFISVLIAAAAGLFFVLSKFKSSGSSDRDRNQIIKHANKRLAQNPKDTEAVSILANLYFNEEIYDKSVHLFKVLLDQTSTNPKLDEADIAFKYAISLLRTGKTEDAYKYLAYVRSFNKDHFETNYNLGLIEYERNNYEKAYLLFSAARTQLPDHAMTLHYLGKSLYYIGKYADSIAYLRKSIEINPGDKEVLYLLGNAYNESGKIDNAYKIYSHLRPDPQYGPASSLESGQINLSRRNYTKAIEDFEIGLKHKEIESSIRLALLYKLAHTYIKENRISDAINQYNKIVQIHPDYKDVKALRKKYSELASNKNLKIYLMSPTSEFVNLCRKLAPLFFPGEHIKITDITAAKNDYVDITAELTTDQSEDIALLRFIRTSASVGDIMLRDLYFRSKDIRAGKSLCITAGLFTDTAEKFVEARTIDLVDNKKLLTLLSKVSAG